MLTENFNRPTVDDHQSRSAPRESQAEMILAILYGQLEEIGRQPGSSASIQQTMDGPR